MHICTFTIICRYICVLHRCTFTIICRYMCVLHRCTFTVICRYICVLSVHILKFIQFDFLFTILVILCSFDSRCMLPFTLKLLRLCFNNVSITHPPPPNRTKCSEVSLKRGNLTKVNQRGSRTMDHDRGACPVPVIMSQ